MKSNDNQSPLNEDDFLNKKEDQDKKEDLKEVKQNISTESEEESPVNPSEKDTSISDSHIEDDDDQNKKSGDDASDDSDFVNDDEDRYNNDAYDDDGDGEHVSEDADHASNKQNEEEQINYDLLTKEDIVRFFSDKLKTPDMETLRDEVDRITEAFDKKHNAEYEEKKERFLAEGGIIEDFKPIEDHAEKQMRELLEEFRVLKSEYNKQLEQTKKENLDKKNEILEQFRVLMEGQERFEKTFRQFKELQKSWFAIGIVPQQNVKDLWDSYNYFVDKFNDYVRINRELRALDLKKNLELKLQLCEKAELLEMEKSVINAFKTLQKYHARWREIGPVPRENREEVWDRFKAATATVNRKHQDHHSKMKESLHENLIKKTELCEQVEAIANGEYNSHSLWIERTNEILRIQKNWKSIGYAPKKDNNAIYARFRSACDTFFNKKAKFYAAAFEKQQENMALKIKIIEQAEALQNSENWKETTQEMIALQKQWKEVGPVPRKESDKLWKRFRLACDKFFNKKAHYFEDIDTTFEENLKKKEAILKEMDGYAAVDDRPANLEMIEEFQERFSEIGFVPNEKKDEIKDLFREALDRLLDRMGLDEHDRNMLKFKSRVSNILQSPRAEMKIRFERDKLVNKLQQLRNDIGVWENNIGFFIESKSSQDTINGFQEKIENAHIRIKILEDKIKLLDDMENEN